MSLPFPLHQSRLQILYTLRHAESVRYTDLMRAMGLESDVFKFHLRILVENQLAVKNEDGTYSLTTSGKEFANNLDESTGHRSRSPKVSMLLIASRQDKDAGDVYLFQKRLRSPFYGYWGLISAPVAWGESIETSAKKEFTKQTGLSAEMHVRGFCRVRDYLASDRSVLEDKIFIIVEASSIEGAIQKWAGGITQWMTRDEYNIQPQRFTITDAVIDHVGRGTPYFEIDNQYSVEEY